MKGKGRFFIGLAITLAVLVVGAVVVVMIQNQPGKVEPVTLNCVGGSEKTALMADPDVKRILQDKYGVTVNWRSMGSYDTVLQSSEQIKQRGYDCLWPSSASAQSVFNDRHSGQFPDLRAETVLQSPLVIYAGPQGTEALLKAGIVAERDGKYFVVNLKSLLLDHTLAGKTWQQLQAGNLRGPINISSTDPVKSNSGFTLAQLELMVVATHDITAPPNIEQARKALATMRKIYDSQGLQATSSDNGFRQWLTQGGELSSPLYAGYENQITQFYVSQSGNKNILKQVKVLYPDPTIYSDHPLLAVTKNGSRLIDGLADIEIQTIAWKKYGFRSATNSDINDLNDFPDIPLAEQFRITPAPSGEVTLALLSCLQDRTKCA